jgi:D-threo-aldose 1-dehydrogenase
MRIDEQTRIGTTELHVPRLGLGTAPLGGWPDRVSEEQGVETAQGAWDAGIRLFDTAPFYGFGQSERFLGSVLPGVPRDEFVISTKVGRVLVPGERDESLFKGAGAATADFDFSADAVRASLEGSRERLGLEHIDIALIHDPDDHHEQALDDALPAMAEMKENGQISAVGVGMNWIEPLAAFTKEANFDCFLMAGRYTLLEQDSLDELLPTCVERRISIIAGGVYNSGILADPRAKAYYNYSAAPEDLIERALAIESVCKRFEVPLRAAAIQFPLHHPAVATVVVGARSAEEMEENVALMSQQIPPELWTALKDEKLLREDAPTPSDRRVRAHGEHAGPGTAGVERATPPNPP